MAKLSATATWTITNPLRSAEGTRVPRKPQQNAVGQSAIWRGLKESHAAGREVKGLFRGVDVASIPNVGADGNRLWPEAVFWAAACLNRSATKANIGWWSPSEVFVSRTLELQMVLFFSSPA